MRFKPRCYPPRRSHHFEASSGSDAGAAAAVPEAASASGLPQLNLSQYVCGRRGAPHLAHSMIEWSHRKYLGALCTQRASRHAPAETHTDTRSSREREQRCDGSTGAQEGAVAGGEGWHGLAHGAASTRDAILRNRQPKGTHYVTQRLGR